MFFGIMNPDPSLFCTDQDPATAINKQKNEETLISSILRLYLLLINEN
jgi:hypothetical protein